MNGLEDISGRTYGHTDGHTRVIPKGPSTDGGETKKPTILMNQSEEKSKKPHF